jgi:hypothetical protein
MEGREFECSLKELGIFFNCFQKEKGMMSLHCTAIACLKSILHCGGS